MTTFRKGCLRTWMSRFVVFAALAILPAEIAIAQVTYLDLIRSVVEQVHLARPGDCSEHEPAAPDTTLWDKAPLLMYDRRTNGMALVILVTTEREIGLSLSESEGTNKFMAILDDREYASIQEASLAAVQSVPQGLHSEDSNKDDSGYFVYFNASSSAGIEFSVRYRDHEDHAGLSQLIGVVFDILHRGCWIRNENVF